MAKIPTAEELRQKAEDTRAEAEQFKHPDFQAHMLKIAAEYERLAKRADEAKERERLRVQPGVLESWFN